MRRVEFKGDDADQPSFTIIELHNADEADRTPAREETPTQDR